MFVIFSIQIIFLLHISCVYIIWGDSSKYEKRAKENASMQSSLYHSVGVLSGPQFVRVMTTSPERCDEDMWLGALVLFLACPVYFTLVASVKSFERRYVSVSDESSSRRHADTEANTNTNTTSSISALLAAADSPSPSKLSDDLSDTPHDQLVIPAQHSKSIRVICTCLGAIALQAFLSILMPINTLDSDIKATCALYESRFGLRGYGLEHVDTVLVFANMLLMVCTPYSTSRMSCAGGVFVALLTYIVIWLTTEASYTYFVAIMATSFLSWEYLYKYVEPHATQFIYSEK